MITDDAINQNLRQWDELFQHRQWGRYAPEELIRFTARRFANVTDRSSIRILEIGCGTGANLWYFSREGFATYGMDFSATALAEVKRRLKAEGLAAEELKEGNFATLPWPDDYFDMVADIEALVANPTSVAKAAVSEVLRVLKPGGTLFSKLFSDQTTGAGTGKMVEPRTTENPTEGPCSGLGLTHFYTEDDLHNLFADFSDISIDYQERSDNNRAIRVSEWLVSATKAAK